MKKSLISMAVLLLVLAIGWCVGYQHGKHKTMFSHVVTAWLRAPLECNKFLAQGNTSNLQFTVNQVMDGGIIMGAGLRRSWFLSRNEKTAIDKLLVEALSLRENSPSMRVMKKCDPRFSRYLDDFRRDYPVMASEK